MAYMCCKYIGRECFACGDCQPEYEYICPVCGEEAEKAYVSKTDYEILGCDNCITEKEAYEVLNAKN